MAGKFIKTFESHRAKDSENKSVSEEKVNETVKQVDDIYKVGSINIPQSLINSYVKKVKDETEKNLRQLYSDMEIAEELVRYAVDTHLNSDDLPVSALLGGADEEEEEIATDLETETPEEDIETEEEPEEEEAPEEEPEEGGEEDLDMEEEGGEDFEEPTEGEEEEAPEEEEEAPEEGGEEETDLPI